MALAQQQQALLQADGLRLLRRRVLGAVGGVLSTYRAPDNDRFQRWRGLAAGGEANHRYQPLDDQDSPARRSRDMVGWPLEPAASGCGQGLRIGLIDGPIFLQHPLLLGARIEAASVLPQGVPPAPMRHGTGVASVLVGQRDTPGLLPGAQLIALAVMRSRGDLVDTTAEWLIHAVDRLVGARVGAINLSLGGPANRWLGEVLERARAKGVVLVAAAGNGGPDSAVVFPASHPSVLAVTSVDLASRIDPHAPRGDAIALAAPGVDVPVAADDGGVVYRSGSSYAAPFVSAALAAGADPQALQRAARDLGIPGRDPVYGWGLLQAEHPCVFKR
ncbi:MAG: S8 family serine peptidase [Burkholderiaceae bacterium]